MGSYNLADAKAKLSALVARAEGGEEIEICRRGKPVARIVPIERPKGRLDVDKLRELTSRMKMYEDPDGLSFVDRMRREDRY